MKNLKPNPKLAKLIRMPSGKRKYVLTNEGTRLLTQIYPDTPNERISSIFGISEFTIKRFKHELGLSKSPEYKRELSLRFLAKGREKLKEIGYVPTLPKYDREYLSQRAKRLWRMEKFRVYNGEPQQTKIRLRQPYSKRRAKIRLRLKSKHYIPLTSKDALSWYYDCSTQRSLQSEATARKVGFTFHPFR